MQVKDVSNFS